MSGSGGLYANPLLGEGAKPVRLDQAGRRFDETTFAKEAKNTARVSRKAPRLFCLLAGGRRGLKYGLSGDLAPAAATYRVGP